MTDKPDLRLVLEHYHVELRGERRETQVLCPVHEESRPSCSVNLDKGLIHCLGGETLVMTPDGDIPIAELAGTEPTLLTTRGWRSAPVRMLGVQELWTVTLSRNGIQREVRATAEHRWYTRTGESVTSRLRPGARLRHVTGPSSPPKPSPWGVAHGFTFGDGHRVARGSIASFNGSKDEALKRYFLDEPRTVTPTLSRVANLPNFFKVLPPEDESPAYLYGWLAGYFAADGHVDSSGTPVLTSANRANLEFVKRVFGYRLGVFTHDIRTTMRSGFGAEPSEIHALTFSRSSLSEAFFLIEEHRRRFMENRNVKERKGYTVVSVERTGKWEPVYCATVEGVGNFALAGNLLTGNCMSCGFGGDSFDIIARKEGLDDFSAVVAWAEEKLGFSRGDVPRTTGRGGARVHRGKGFAPRYRNAPARGRPLSST